MGQISSYTLTPLTCEVLIVGAGCRYQCKNDPLANVKLIH